MTDTPSASPVPAVPGDQSTAKSINEWPEACQSMLNMAGWREVSCETRDRFMWGVGDERGYAERLSVFSSLTDPDGTYGTPVIYTEWGVKDGEKPWLRDYRYPSDGDRCAHFMPEANIAWF